MSDCIAIDFCAEIVIKVCQMSKVVKDWGSGNRTLQQKI